MKICVFASPNAHKNEILGWEKHPLAGNVLRIRIAASPTEGKANAALRQFLADSLHLAKSQVQLQKGDTSRFKTFEIPDSAQSLLPPLL